MDKQTFYNAIILEGDNLEITRGYLVIHQGIIEKICEGMPFGHKTDLKRGFVLPPFINAHTHIADAVSKELYLGKKQPEVVGPGVLIFLALDSAREDEIITAMRSAIEDMLQTGTIAHFDFREGGAEGVKLLRMASKYPVNSIAFGRPSTMDELDDVLKVADGIGLPSVDAFKPKLLRDIADRVSKANKLFALHVAERRDIPTHTPKDEIRLALRLKPSFMVHVTWATEHDLKVIRRAKVPVVFCPRANSLFSVGVPPLHIALALNVKFCLGTDNVTACQPNMFEELAFAWACLRRADDEVGAEEARKLLKAATLAPLSIFKLPWGAVKEGNPATFLILARGKNLVNLTDVHAGLVNRARADNIRAIYVNGKIL
ncbi:MAG: amidohydrolase family protein [Hadesarchaea archaeon]|nr:amidohydrolase family protein [Hadesarchaea archaeon]